MSDIQLIHGDCMEYMATLPDKAFDLAIVDPPYGIHERLLRGAGFMAKSPQRERYKQKQWDKSTPPPEYFVELFRVSKNQIIFGGNYFDLPPTRCVIAWVKPPMKNHPHFSQWEMAWTSFSSSAKVVEVNPAHMEGATFHPTQKPIALYKWILHNYANEGDRILDTHLGSGSIALACHDMKFDLVATEIDVDYFNEATKRLNNHRSQTTLF